MGTTVKTLPRGCKYPESQPGDPPYTGKHIRFDANWSRDQSYIILTAVYELPEYDNKQAIVQRHLTKGGIDMTVDELARVYDWEGPIGPALFKAGMSEFVGREVPLYNQHREWPEGTGRYRDSFGWSRATKPLSLEELEELGDNFLEQKPRAKMAK